MAIRLAVVMTHPVQYFAPWFRHIAQSCPEIDLHVLYGVSPNPRQQGVGFGVGLTWDQPLLDGYSCRVVRPMRSNESLDRFFDLDVPELAAELRAFEPEVALIPGWNSRLLNTRASYSGSHFFLTFVLFVPTRAFLIFSGKSEFHTTRPYLLPRQIYLRFMIQARKLIFHLGLE